ncbi:protein-export membrane protein SecF [Candidatus Gottesmanbacteria bacterium RIFCSPLOWO2_01_FULL_46_9]|uniref:Protein-export membrane protein SecF n=1 Tax=Candidatus Gottesmanbacteria bacterium RIFCSPLOWO2_01_FULL_46_9 TaxID=1798394 RepID=A0A1F6AX62_9BACT|nr:MAG: protein-export membrane protein SecF [Candidatus Gottesmanbacteria bacterium RIFCSPLOWO2_01_FULL_46_9]
MIRFSKFIWLYFLISAVVLIPGMFALIRFGLRPAIDFTGGTLIEVKYAVDMPQSSIESVLKKQQLTAASIQKSSNREYIIRLKPEGAEKLQQFETAVTSLEPKKSEIVRNETVGPILGKELLQKTVTAALFAIIAILSYVGYAFRNIKFGVSAVVALVHDLLVVLGIFALLGVFYKVEVDTLFVTAFLTTMSFSVHDTIVVFDRIRELLKRSEKLPFETLCDKALTETMGRSFANSMTIIFMLLALVLLGGNNIRWFVFALLIGTIAGTYSSPFIATPVLVLWDRFEKRKR